MSYKKDMSKYEHLEGWERCGFGEQLDKWAEKYVSVQRKRDQLYGIKAKSRLSCGSFSA